MHTVPVVTSTDMIRWVIRPFTELSVSELHRLYRLRQDVFVLEQACLYPDIDDIDPRCEHLLGFEDGEVVACARIMPPGLVSPHTSFGRVAVAQSHRCSGLGRELTGQILTHCDARYPGCTIRISAQTYLVRFYESFGFTVDGEPFEEDGIPHIHMLR